LSEIINLLRVIDQYFRVKRGELRTIKLKTSFALLLLLRLL